MNTKHPDYKDYIEVLKKYISYEPINKYQPDSQEDWYFDKIHYGKYERFSKYKRLRGKKYYANKLNRQFKAQNKITLKRVVASVESGNYDLASPRKEFKRLKKTVLWWHL